MTPEQCLIVLTRLSTALHSRGDEKDRHIKMAMDSLRPHLPPFGATGKCVRDSTMCAPECNYGRNLYGRCARDA